MTTAAQNGVTVYPLSGTGVGPFATTWTYEASIEVTAALEADGIESPLTFSTDFTVTGATPLISGGSVTLNAGLVPEDEWDGGAVAYRLILRRATVATQSLAFGSVDRYQPAATEEALDRVARRTQDIAAAALRCVTVPEGEALGLPGADVRAGKVLAFGDDGEVDLSRGIGSFDDDVSQAHDDAASALTSKNAAAGSATAAANSATAAAGSATAAANSATAAAGSATTTSDAVTAFEALLGGDADTAVELAAAISADATAAGGSATAASGSATAAAGSATSAANSATAASGSATAAAGSATAAAGSATSAANSATAAAASATTVAGAVTDFEALLGDDADTVVELAAAMHTDATAASGSATAAANSATAAAGSASTASGAATAAAGSATTASGAATAAAASATAADGSRAVAEGFKVDILALLGDSGLTVTEMMDAIDHDATATANAVTSFEALLGGDVATAADLADAIHTDAVQVAADRVAVADDAAAVATDAAAADASADAAATSEANAATSAADALANLGTLLAALGLRIVTFGGEHVPGTPQIWLAGENGTLGYGTIDGGVVDFPAGMKSVPVLPGHVPGTPTIWLLGDDGTTGYGTIDGGVVDFPDGLGDAAAQSVVDYIEGLGGVDIGVPAAWGHSYLHRWNAAEAKPDPALRTVLLAGSDSQFDFAPVPQALKDAWQAGYGDGGYGLVSVDASVELDGVAVSRSGGWTLYDVSPDHTSADAPLYGCGVDGKAISTTGTTDTFTIGSTTFSRLRVLYEKDGGGTFTVAIDGGAGVNVVASGSGLGVYDLTVADGAHTVAISTASNTGRVTLYHPLLTRDTGLVLFKGANGGSDSTQIAVIIEDPYYQACLAEIDPDLTIINGGMTNSYRFPHDTPADFVTHLSDLVDVHRAQTNSAILLTSAPPSDSLSIIYPLDDYRRAMWAVAKAKLTGWSDLYADFGSPWSVMDDLGFWNDSVHPSTLGGVRIGQIWQRQGFIRRFE